MYNRITSRAHATVSISILLLICTLPSNLFAHANIAPQEAQQMIQTDPGLIIIDVREDYEFCGTGGHIPCAANYPINAGVLSTKYNELPLNADILVVCKTGSRSNLAAEFLDAKGFTSVYDMTEGMNSWPGETTGCNAASPLQVAVWPLQAAVTIRQCNLDTVTDINGDGRIGLEEALCALQSAAALRPGPDIDNDHDGYTENQGDCNDGNSTIHPGATEICGDGIDQDCSAGDLECPGVDRFAGKYNGTYSGTKGSSGSWSLTVDSQGNIYGTEKSNINEEYAIFGTVNNNGNLSFAVGFTSSGATFQGTIQTSGSLAGTWHNNNSTENGTFSGSGQLGVPTPAGIEPFVGKYSGTFAGDDSGTFNMYVDAYGNVVVVIVSGDAARGTVDSGGNFSVTNSYGNVSASGKINTSGYASGTWYDNSYPASGSFSCNKQ